MKRAPRGFTLLELIVGAVLALLVASVAMGVLLSVQQVQRDAQSRNAIARDAQFALETIGYDLQYLGAGVPRGAAIDPVGELRPAMRIATSRYLAFVGDLPYPNSDLNGIAVMNAMDGSSPTTREVVVTSELSPCAPESGSPGLYNCNQHQHTLVPINAGAGDNCREGDIDKRLCPWGLGKWQRGANGSVALTFIAPNGRWESRRWSMNSGTSAGGWSDLSNSVRAGPHLDNGQPDLAPRTVYEDNVSGVALVAQLDRVFYSLEAVGGGNCTFSGPGTNCVLMRRQCWGPLGDPDAAGFPAAGGSPILSASDPAACASPNDGLPWETVINGIDEFTFRFFREPAVELFSPLDATDLAQVQYVEVDLTISRVMTGSNALLTERIKRRFYVENSGGYEDGTGATPPGSCTAGVDPWCGRF